jgi:hypothetical protein
MALDFPASPVLNQTYSQTFPTGDLVYTFNGTSWIPISWPTGLAPASVVLTASGLLGTGATATFNNTAIGAASADRLVVVCVGTIRFAPAPITSVTINGAAATQIASVNSAGGATSGIFVAAVPTGTTCNIVCATAGSPCDNISAQVFTAKGLATPGAPFHSATSGADNGSAALNIPWNGVAIGVATGYSGGSATPAYAWSGLSADYDAQLVYNSNERASVAHLTGMAAQTGRAISISGGGTSDALAVASWQ